MANLKIKTQSLLIPFLIFLATAATKIEALSDTNGVYIPCSDAKVQISDGFTFGLVFSSRDSFFYNQSHQLSPCDSRLSLSSMNSQLAVFRPKVDEISLLTVNTSNFFPVMALI